MIHYKVLVTDPLSPGLAISFTDLVQDENAELVGDKESSSPSHGFATPTHRGHQVMGGKSGDGPSRGQGHPV